MLKMYLYFDTGQIVEGWILKFVFLPQILLNPHSSDYNNKIKSKNQIVSLHFNFHFEAKHQHPYSNGPPI